MQCLERILSQCVVLTGGQFVGGKRERESRREYN